MKALLLMVQTEIQESLRARWFFTYLFIFGGAVLLLFTLRITESQVMGFTGLGRLLLTYIQLAVAILPIFVLITMVRTVVGDKENNVMEYLLSLPIPLAAYYWGKLLGRFVVIFIPVTLTMFAAALWGALKGFDVPWALLGYYSLLLGTLSWCYMGFGILISTMVRRLEVGLGLGFLVWLVSLFFIDIILIGVLIRQHVGENTVVMLALLNPLQDFRLAAIMLFDPEMSVLGPTALVIQDKLGVKGFMVFAQAYPMLLGWLLSLVGYKIFKSGDLI
ncbi:MAG: ABC transporter permease [Deltaproteobacteria bacterium]|nr:ABC transporter permease [Deltaproteobacteria bacterium]